MNFEMAKRVASALLSINRENRFEVDLGDRETAELVMRALMDKGCRVHASGTRGLLSISRSETESLRQTGLSR